MKTGTRVICINDTGTAPNYNTIDPNYPAQEIVEGQEYVVRWVGRTEDPFYEGTYTGVRLVGVVRPVDPVSGQEDKPFKADRFRPVVSGRNEKVLEVENG